MPFPNPNDERYPIHGVADAEPQEFASGAASGLEYGGPQMDPGNVYGSGPGGIAPTPQYPEKPTNVYERSWGENRARRGALRFQEGVETDTDIPRNFAVGVTAGADVNITHRKNPDETLQERAHVGSASWIEAPSMLGQFANGAGEPPQRTNYEYRNGARQQRINPVTIQG